MPTKQKTQKTWFMAADAGKRKTLLHTATHVVGCVQNVFSRGSHSCSIAQWRGDWTPVCSEGLTASQRTPQMAHMDRMITVHVWGMREEQNSKRARE